MGGFFMPSMTGPSNLSIPGLISQGITAIAPVLARLGGGAASGTVSKVATAAGKVLAGGAGFGIGTEIAESLLQKAKQGVTGLFTSKKRHRHMNFANGRALRRSIRRVQGFNRMARKSFYFEKRVKIKRHRRAR